MCLRCGEVVKECKPWDGDVLVVRGEGDGEGKPSSGKSIAWADEVVGDDEEGAEGELGGTMSWVDPMPVESEEDGD